MLLLLEANYSNFSDGNLRGNLNMEPSSSLAISPIYNSFINRVPLKMNGYFNNVNCLAYSFCTLDVNGVMKAINGNTKNSITLAHWNGGGSFLGKSLRGKEKLQDIKNILTCNNIDVLGVSEANLDSNLEEYNYKIQGFNIIKSPGNVARTVTYIRENIVYKELINYGGDLSCNWLEIGKGQNKLLVCNYYREFKTLGVEGSNSFNEQCARLDTFLEIIKKSRDKQNVIIL